MNAVKSWFGGGSSEDVPPASVLAEWNKYSGVPGAAKPSTSQSSSLLAAEEGTAASMGRLVVATLSTVSSSVTGAASSLQR